MRSWPTLVLAMSTIIPSSSCATLFGTQNKDFDFASNPSGATITVDGNPAGTAPVKLKLSNNMQHIVIYHLDGYQDVTCTLTKGTGAGWVVLDVLGGLIPVIIDAATGKWSQTKGRGCTQQMIPVKSS